MEPWLLEVNLSPSLATEEMIDKEIKTKLMANLFTLTGVVGFENRGGK